MGDASMSTKPQRIQLSRRKGWRMPPNTVKVDRSTRFGNPFIVGANGSALECVYHFGLMVSGYICASSGHACFERQEASAAVLKAEKSAGWPNLKGKNLACWCAPGKPCHADVLLCLANGNIKAGRELFAELVAAVQEQRSRK
jgi:hypothetical protein